MKTVIVEIIRADKTEFRRINDLAFRALFMINNYERRDEALLIKSTPCSPSTPDYTLTIDGGREASSLSWESVKIP